MNTTVAHPSRRAGFTMIELVMVVTLMLTLTSIVAPTFKISESRLVENQAHLIVAHLELARAQALGNRKLVRVQFDGSTNSYTAYADHDEDGSVTAIQAEVDAFAEFGARELEDLIVFGKGSASDMPNDPGSASITLGSERIEMDNQGLPSPWGTMGTIYLTHSRDPNAVAAVSVASSGAFKAWRWNAAAGKWQ